MAVQPLASTLGFVSASSVLAAVAACSCGSKKTASTSWAPGSAKCWLASAGSAGFFRTWDSQAVLGQPSRAGTARLTACRRTAQLCFERLWGKGAVRGRLWGSAGHLGQCGAFRAVPGILGILRILRILASAAHFGHFAHLRCCELAAVPQRRPLRRQLTEW